MIAVHFPEEPNTDNTMQRHNNSNINNIPRHSRDFVIQVDPEEPPKLNLSAMKLFNRFRKIVMRLIFSMPSRSSSGSSSSGGGGMTSTSTSTPRKRNSISCDRFEPPKTSCSSYYSSHSHYNEAISDCIDFCNKSSSAQDCILDFDSESNYMV